MPLHDPAQIFGFNTHPRAQLPTNGRELMSTCVDRLHPDQGGRLLIEHCKKHGITFDIASAVFDELREKGKSLEATFVDTDLESQYSGADAETAYEIRGLEAAYNAMREQYRSTYDSSAYSVWNSVVSPKWPDMVMRPFPQNEVLQARVHAITLPEATSNYDELKQVLTLLDKQRDVEMAHAVQSAKHHCTLQVIELQHLREKLRQQDRLLEIGTQHKEEMSAWLTCVEKGKL